MKFLYREGGRMFANGVLNLTNWAANVIMPTLAGLMFAAGVYRFGKAQPYAHLAWGGFASLVCSGLLRLLTQGDQLTNAVKDLISRHSPAFPATLPTTPAQQPAAARTVGDANARHAARATA